MPNILENRVKETSTSTGTGGLTLGGALTGHRAFSAKCAVGDTFRYGLQGVDANGVPSGEWEVGIGTYSAANQITRTTVLDSSSAGAAVNLAAGTKQVWMGMDAAQAGWIKEVLSADRTYYVATTGSNAASGLAVGSPWLTIQKAADFISRNLDLNGFNVTVQLADGTYTENLVAKPAAGSGTILVKGNVATPANVLLTSATGLTVSADGPLNTQYKLDGVKIASGNACVFAGNRARITLGAVNFGASTYYHMQAYLGGEIVCAANYTVSGNTTYHAYAYLGGMIAIAQRTITLSGAIAFSDSFVTLASGSRLYANGCTFTGTATGKRYALDNASLCYIGVASTTYFPGSVTGTSVGGSVYG